MGHVRNVHAHLHVAVGQDFKRQRVVKILGVCGVNGKRQNIPKIPASSDFRGIQFRVQRRGVCLHFRRKRIRQSVFLQNGVDLRIVFARTAQHLKDPANGVELGVGPFHEFHHRHVPVLGAVQSVFGQVKVLSNPTVVGNEEGVLRGNVQRTNIGLFGALNDFHHLTFLAKTRAGCGKKQNFDAVSVEGRAGVGVPNVDVLFHFRAGDEPGAGLRQIQFAFNKTLFKKETKHIGRAFYRLLRAHHQFQGAPHQGPSLFVGQAYVHGQIVQRKTSAGAFGQTFVQLAGNGRCV